MFLCFYDARKKSISSLRNWRIFPRVVRSKSLNSFSRQKMKFITSSQIKTSCTQS